MLTVNEALKLFKLLTKKHKKNSSLEGNWKLLTKDVILSILYNFTKVKGAFM